MMLLSMQSLLPALPSQVSFTVCQATSVCVLNMNKAPSLLRLLSLLTCVLSLHTGLPALGRWAHTRLSSMSLGISRAAAHCLLAGSNALPLGQRSMLDDQRCLTQLTWSCRRTLEAG
jgi:hypothetical protein